MVPILGEGKIWGYNIQMIKLPNKTQRLYPNPCIYSNPAYTLTVLKGSGKGSGRGWEREGDLLCTAYGYGLCPVCPF